MADSLDQKFENKVNSVAQYADETSKGQLNEGQTVWATLDDEGPEGPGPERFLKSFREEFDRTALGKEYIRLNSAASSGQSDVKTRVSEVGLVRLQYDWLMQLERDFLMRKHTRLRTEAHSAAIQEMLGFDEGPVTSGILRLAKQTLARAGEKE